MVVWRRAEHECSRVCFLGGDEPGSSARASLPFLVTDANNEGWQDRALLAVGDHLNLAVDYRAKRIHVGRIDVILSGKVIRHVRTAERQADLPWLCK